MTRLQYIAYAKDAYAPTEGLFQLLPEDRIDWKPTDASFTAGQLMHHIAGGIAVYANGIKEGSWGFTSMRHRFVENRKTESVSVAEGTAQLREAVEYFIKTVEALTDEEYNHGEVFTPQFGQAPRWRVGMLALEHHLKHMTEFFMYLKMIGVPVHTGHLYVKDYTR